jgi:Pyridoxamine 5'-phosphate oxidase
VARWADIEAQEPEFAATVRGFLEAHKHKTLATLRRDGSPRISGTEAYLEDGDVWFGSMWGARKARDLQRDPRFALHSGSDDPPDWKGDAKLSGRVAEEVAEGEQGKYHRFVADISEAVVTRMGDPADHLVIELWREGEGVRRMRR